MATKNNPGKFDCLAKCADDEPYFLLRAKDPVAPAFVKAWRAVRAGDYEEAQYQMKLAWFALEESGRTLLPKNSDKSLEAQSVADAMKEWRKNSAQV